MGLEGLTEGAVITESDITEYGLKPTELKIGRNGPTLYERDRTRVCLEPKETGVYLVGAKYELP